ncbi:class I SAM-dependent methyltransferase [Piscinibacter koreensis]|uniref:Methyltransferase regulatory domain-containing protein n=1 Tax=Piscinibacter koreensis TaxID=2742824 RepID=A0A7Y6TX07_9BURK|nr:class I SAM-dependent methyltransferase [Schlegelella koreensis]NUZ06618.1 methyltransferase regulatory domain-containing protein [Schlegelella koreensis]
MLSTDTSNAALVGRYDEIPYDAKPHEATHPARLAAIATLAGHAGPAQHAARVLEVGCSEGVNLIAMAVSMPAAQFVGCDLSPRAIAAGRAMVDTLGLGNVTLVEGDLAELPAELGAFDFVIAHGVYSWVPAPVRDALFALAQQRLTPAGIAYVSFNVLPGCRVRQAAWDVLHRHVDLLDSARARVDAARALAQQLATVLAPSVEADQALRAEFRALAERSDSELFHDDLAVPNEPVLFDTFARHAAEHGLRWLGEAQLQSTSVGDLPAETQDALARLEPLAREQYLDFVRLRRFRQSLLVRVDAPTDARPPVERVAALHVSASWELARLAGAGGIHKLAKRLDPASGGGGAIRKLLETLVANQPAALPVAALPDLIGGALARPLDTVLVDAAAAGLVTLHAEPPPLTVQPGERPLASPLARLQARTASSVTTLAHTHVSIADAQAMKLLPLVDGSRDRAALGVAAGHIAPALGARSADFVNFALDKFARLGLLAVETPANGSVR